jgi:hypothetical protein
MIQLKDTLNKINIVAMSKVCLFQKKKVGPQMSPDGHAGFFLKKKKDFEKLSDKSIKYTTIGC